MPQRAVQRTPQGDGYVFAVGDDGTAVRKSLTIQEANGSNWVVTEGLSAGDQIVISGFQNLRAGMPVQVIGTSSDELASVKNADTETAPE